MKRLIVIFLLIATVLASFVGCVENDEPDSTEATTTEGSVVTDDPNAENNANIPQSDNPKLDFNQEKIKILSRDVYTVDDEIAVDAINGDAVNDAVYNRNLAVEEKLNVQIENELLAGDNYAIYNKIKTLHGSSDAAYDFFANSVYSTIMYTSEGMFADLTQLDYLELSKPWFAQNFIEVATNGDALYMVTGSLALSMYRYIFVTFFNEGMISNVMQDDGVDLYDVARNGDWTLDYQLSIAERIYEDRGAQGKSEEDIFGFITNGDQIGVDPYWSSCNLKIIDKTSDGWYEIVLDIERLTTAVSKINALVNECESSWSYPHNGADKEQNTIREKFAGGGAAMATLRLVEAEEGDLRNMKDVYGILPIPKLDKKDPYYSYAHDQMTAFGIMTLVSNDDERFQRAGAVLNEMNYQSLITVQPDYYELTLKSKYMNNPKSWEMLDIIVKSLYIDAGVLYTKNLESIHQKLRSVVGDPSKSVASTFGSAMILVELRLNEMVDSIQKMQERAN